MGSEHCSSSTTSCAGLRRGCTTPTNGSGRYLACLGFRSSISATICCTSGRTVSTGRPVTWWNMPTAVPSPGWTTSRAKADHAYVAAHHCGPGLLHHVNPRIGLREDDLLAPSDFAGSLDTSRAPLVASVIEDLSYSRCDRTSLLTNRPCCAWSRRTGCPASRQGDPATLAEALEGRSRGGRTWWAGRVVQFPRWPQELRSRPQPAGR